MEKVYYKRLLCPRGTILPDNRQTADPGHLTLVSFLNSTLTDIKAVNLIIAISTAVKTISATLRKKALSGMQVLGFNNDEAGPTEAEIANEIFFQFVKDTGVVWQVGCASHPGPDTFRESANPEYIVNYTAQDGIPDHPGTSCFSSAFAIFKKSPDPSVTDHTLQPGRNILYSGYAVYGSATVLYVSLQKSRVDGFLVDPHIGELILIGEDLRIPIASPIYTINEGLSFHYSQKLLDWLESKKNPKKHLGAKGRYIVSKIADVHRILKNGGIYCHPHSKFMDTLVPHHLVYECQPLGHIITQAGGLATDGKSWLLDVQPTHLHCTSALFIGSSSDVISLLKHINPDLIKVEEEEPEESHDNSEGPLKLNK